MGVIKKYNEEITLILFCLGLLFYSIGLSQFTRSIQTQSLFHIGGLIFIIFHYKVFNKYTLHVLLVPIICFGVVGILSFLTIFDDVYPREVYAVLKDTNQNVIGFFALFAIVFLYTMHAKARNASILLCFFAALCVFEILTMLYLGYKNGLVFNGAKNVPFFFKAVFTYNIWLLAPAALCLAAMFVCKKRLHKCLAFLGLIAVFIAILANSERSFLVAFVVMIFVPFFAWHYRHKFAIICSALVVGAVFLSSFYHISKSLPERYNFAHMVDNFLIVWNTPPAEMGQYDAGCFVKQKWLQCTDESLQAGQNTILWEHSALSRLNMTKSTLLAFLDEPLKPHAAGVFSIGRYLYRYYERTNPQNRSYIFLRGTEEPLNGYNSPHNFAVSLLFCYGLIGFVAILVFIGFVLYGGHKGVSSANREKCFWGLSLVIFTCGICVQSLFDVIYVIILQTIFVWFGALGGLMWRKN